MRRCGTAAAGNGSAETGTFVTVSALSCYGTTAGGDPLVFSAQLNNIVSAAPEYAENAVAAKLAGAAGNLIPPE